MFRRTVSCGAVSNVVVLIAGFVLISVVLWAGSFNLSTIVLAQKGFAWGWVNGNFINPLLFPMAVVFFISSLAETQRAPFGILH